MHLKPVIIVEGKNDRSKLSQLLDEQAVDIYCTFGTPGTERLEQLKLATYDRPVYILTDNDGRGRKIRALLREVFPDAEHIYTSKGYAGVEGTPQDYMIERFIKAGLEDIFKPSINK